MKLSAAAALPSAPQPTRGGFGGRTASRASTTLPGVEVLGKPCDCASCARFWKIRSDYLRLRLVRKLGGFPARVRSSCRCRRLDDCAALRGGHRKTPCRRMKAVCAASSASRVIVDRYSGTLLPPRRAGAACRSLTTREAPNEEGPTGSITEPGLRANRT